MRTRVAQWLCFGVFFSVVPLALIFPIYGALGYQLEARDYVPDLILVSFAIAVNALGNAYGRNTKNEALEETCMFLSVASMILCAAYYYFLIGHTMNLNAELLKLAVITEENPELMKDVVSEIQITLEEKLNNMNWSIFMYSSYFVAGISAAFGIAMELKQYRKEKKMRIAAKDYEQVLRMLEQFLKEKKSELSAEEYKTLILETTQFVQSKKVEAESKQLQSLEMGKHAKY